MAVYLLIVAPIMAFFCVVFAWGAYAEEVYSQWAPIDFDYYFRYERHEPSWKPLPWAIGFFLVSVCSLGLLFPFLVVGRLISKMAFGGPVDAPPRWFQKFPPVGTSPEGIEWERRAYERLGILNRKTQGWPGTTVSNS